MAFVSISVSWHYLQHKPVLLLEGGGYADIITTAIGHPRPSGMALLIISNPIRNWTGLRFVRANNSIAVFTAKKPGGIKVDEDFVQTAKLLFTYMLSRESD